MISRLDVYFTMIETGLVPVFYMADPIEAVSFVSDCIAGGVRVVELTNRGSQALEVFQYLRAAYPDLILGAGSIVDAPTAALYIANGANFIVGPGFSGEIAHLCNSRKIAYLPGCGSVTEIHQAERAGVEIVKLFPASHYGPAFVKAVLAPSPWTRFMPTGGVEPTRESIQSWFEAGVSCVGIGSSLTAEGDVTKTCQRVLSWVQQYRRDGV